MGLLRLFVILTVILLFIVGGVAGRDARFLITSP
jgi:hypothetical protein